MHPPISCNIKFLHTFSQQLLSQELLPRRGSSFIFNIHQTEQVTRTGLSSELVQQQLNSLLTQELRKSSQNPLSLDKSIRVRKVSLQPRQSHSKNSDTEKNVACSKCWKADSVQFFFVVRFHYFRNVLSFPNTGLFTEVNIVEATVDCSDDVERYFFL